MKHSFIAAIAALTLLSACNDTEEAKDTRTFPIETYNLIVDNSKVRVSPATSYNFTLERIAGTMQISVSDLLSGDDSKVSFTTSPLKYKGGFFSFDENNYEWVGVSADSPSGTGAEITDLRCELTQAKFPAFTSENASLAVLKKAFPERKAANGLTGFTPVMEYHLGSAYVRTFWPDETFRGTTTIAMGPMGDFKNDVPTYRVIMDLSDSSDYKADVIILGAKFAASMPVELNLILRGLKLEFTEKGYTVINSGDVVPEYLEGDQILPNDSYPFTAFKLVCEDDLTDASVDFSVKVKAMGDRIVSGAFEGSCLALPARD